MKYYTRLKVFKSQQCTFDPHSMTAWSYNWWQFVGCFKGQVTYNGARYSMQTSKQQGIVTDLLRALGVKYKTVYVHRGLQNIEAEIKDNVLKIAELQGLIASPRTQVKTNKRRASWIKDLIRTNKELRRLDRTKRTDYKGKLNFKAIPKPVPLSDDKKAQRAQRRLQNAERRARREVYTTTTPYALPTLRLVNGGSNE